MQTLRINVKNEKGIEVPREVKVLRSWATASGAMLFLHHGSGIYGYLDGSPVKSENELDIIDSPIQREAAKKWWKFTGEKMSVEFYAAKDAAERAKQGDFQARGVTPETELDYVMYRSAKPGEVWSDPFSWIERFAVRPDWWGQARSVAFKDVEYRMAGQDEETLPVKEDGPDKKPSGKKIPAGEI